MIYSSVFVYLTKLLFSGTTVIQLPLKIRQIRKSKAVFTWTSSAVGIYFGLICITIPGEWSEKLLRLSHLIRRNTKITLDALARVLLRFSAAMCFLFGFSLFTWLPVALTIGLYDSVDGFPYMTFRRKSLVLQYARHFRVTLCLSFKTRLRAKPFTLKWVWNENEQTEHISIWMEIRFDTKAQGNSEVACCLNAFLPIYRETIPKGRDCSKNNHSWTKKISKYCTWTKISRHFWIFAKSNLTDYWTISLLW